MAKYLLRYRDTELDLPCGEYRIGRDSECDVRVKGRLASRFHALVRVEGDEVTVEDLSSSNGVYVNGDQIEGPTSISHGDRVYVGLHELTLFSTQRTRHASQFPAGVSSEIDLGPADTNKTQAGEGAASNLHPNDLRMIRLFALGCTVEHVAARMESGPGGVRTEWARLDAQLGLGNEERIRQVAQELGLIPTQK